MGMTFKRYMSALREQLYCNATEEYKSKYVTYIHTNEEVTNNLDFFKVMHHCQISPYKALLYFSDYKDLSDENKKESLKDWEELAIEREQEYEKMRREIGDC